MPMTSDQLRAVRQATGLPAKTFAPLVDCGLRQFTYYESGKKPIPDGVARAAAWIALHGTDFPWKTFGLISESGNRKSTI